MNTALKVGVLAVVFLGCMFVSISTAGPVLSSSDWGYIVDGDPFAAYAGHTYIQSDISANDLGNHVYVVEDGVAYAGRPFISVKP
jgi:hypothetical protein